MIPEILIDDSSIGPPATLEIRPTVVESLRDKVRVEVVQLRKLDAGQRTPPISATKNDTGFLADVQPGEWEVIALARVGTSALLPVARTRVSVPAGANLNISVPVDQPVFSGRVTMGEEPVTGVLNLVPVDRESGATSLTLTLNANGEFHALLEPGPYRAIVHGTGFGIEPTRTVTISDPNEDLLIELPKGRIVGRVVDNRGNAPLDAVSISARPRGQEHGLAGAQANSDGSFVLEGVERGTWDLVAKSRDWRSDAVAVSISDEPVEDVLLTVLPTREVRIRVVDVTDAPVAGVFVHIALPHQNMMGSDDEVRTTREDGTAVFRVTPEQQRMPLSIVVATADLRLTCALERLDGPATVILPSVAGELRLSGQAGSNTQRWLRSQSGCVVPFLATRTTVDDAGTPIVIFPGLAAGGWSYVETHDESERVALLTGRSHSAPAIQSFTIEPGRSNTVSFERH